MSNTTINRLISWLDMVRSISSEKLNESNIFLTTTENSKIYGFSYHLKDSDVDLQVQVRTSSNAEDYFGHKTNISIQISGYDYRHQDNKLPPILKTVIKSIYLLDNSKGFVKLVQLPSVLLDSRKQIFSLGSVDVYLDEMSADDHKLLDEIFTHLEENIKV